MPKAAIRLKAEPDLPDTLATIRVQPVSLFRVSSHDTGEPYFGKYKGNRFDETAPHGRPCGAERYIGPENTSAMVFDDLPSRR